MGPASSPLSITTNTIVASMARPAFGNGHISLHFLSTSFPPLPLPLSSATMTLAYLTKIMQCPYLPGRVTPAEVSFQRKCSPNPRSSFVENGTNVKVSRQMKAEDDIDDEECELVSGVELSIGESSNSISAYFLKAVKNNNGTGILLLSDIFGYEDSSTREFAYRVACNGYNVLVPDLFRGDPWTKDRPKTMFEQWIAKQEPQRVANDIAAAAKWMVDEFVAAGISSKLGVIGFCFGGGRVIELLSQDMRTSFNTGVSFYGTRMDPSAASDVKVPVLFISGDEDPLCLVSVLEDMEQRIGRGSRLVVFKGRGHGFVHRPESPEEDRDAEKAFVIMRNWLSDGLVVQQ